MSSKDEKMLVMKRSRKILPIVKKKNPITPNQLHCGPDVTFLKQGIKAAINIFKELSKISSVNYRNCG